MRAARKASVEVQTLVAQKVEAVKADFPTLWPVDPPAEDVPVEVTEDSPAV